MAQQKIYEIDMVKGDRDVLLKAAEYLEYFNFGEETVTAMLLRMIAESFDGAPYRLETVPE